MYTFSFGSRTTFKASYVYVLQHALASIIKEHLATCQES